MLSIHSLHSYPVKSLEGLDLTSLSFDAFGPENDRRFMLIESETGKFVTQRSHPKMCLLKTQMSDDGLRVIMPGGEMLEYFMSGFSEPVEAQVWGDCVEALASALRAHDQCLSAFLATRVRMVWMPDSCFRQVDRDYYDAPRKVSFADGFPVLITGTASLADLNSKLAHPVSMSRFRPNLVVATSESFEEDRWRRIRVGQIEFAVVKPCSRCVMTTVDEKAQKGKEPLRTLAAYRRNEFGVCFGQNAVPNGLGNIAVGDVVEVLERH